MEDGEGRGGRGREGERGRGKGREGEGRGEREGGRERREGGASDSTQMLEYISIQAYKLVASIPDPRHVAWE